MKTKICNFHKKTMKDSKNLYDLYDILMEIEAVKQNPKYTQLISYYDLFAGIIPVSTNHLLIYGENGKTELQGIREHTM